MAEIGSLVVDMVLKSAEFTRDLDKTSKKIQQSASSSASSLANLEKAFGLVFAQRTINKIISVTEESIALAASMHGPLADAARKVTVQFEELQDTFMLGVARGFIDGMNSGLVNTAENLENAKRAGKLFGDVIQFLTEQGVQFFGHDAPGFIDDLIQKWDDLKEKATEYYDQVKRMDSDIVFSHGESSFAKTTPGKPAAKDVLAYGTALEIAAMQQERFWSATVDTAASMGSEEGEGLLGRLNAETDVLNKMATPMEAYATRLDIIERSHIQGEAAARAHTAANAILVGSFLDLAGQAAGALGTVFKDSKAIAIAQAVINTAQAITKTLAEYGATPWGIAAAAIAAATGAAQIASILSTQPGSSKKPSVGGGGGGSGRVASGAAAAAPGGTTSQTAVTIHLSGGPFFSQEAVRGLISQINDAVGDGATIRTA